MIDEHLHKIYEETLGVNVDPLKFSQFRLAELGYKVLESPTVFNFWLDTPERRELFTTLEGLDTLKEELTELNKEVW